MMKIQMPILIKISLVVILMTSLTAINSSLGRAQPGAQDRPADTLRKPKPRPVSRNSGAAPLSPLACIDPNEPNDDPANATPISYGDFLYGLDICATEGVDVDTDYYIFSGLAGDVVAVDIDSDSIGFDLDSVLSLYASDGTTELAFNDDQNYQTYDSYLTYQLPADGVYYLEIYDYLSGGDDINYRYTIELNKAGSNVGPLVYHDRYIFDDTSGEANGNDDGIPECAESIEMFVDLYNQGLDPTLGLTATLSTTSPYISWIFPPTSEYPGAPPSDFSTNDNDFDFSIHPVTPNGHIAEFEISMTADNGGPWTDSFSIEITCLYPYHTFLPLVVKSAP